MRVRIPVEVFTFIYMVIHLKKAWINILLRAMGKQQDIMCYKALVGNWSRWRKNWNQASQFVVPSIHTTAGAIVDVFVINAYKRVIIFYIFVLFFFFFFSKSKCFSLSLYQSTGSRGINGCWRPRFFINHITIIIVFSLLFVNIFSAIYYNYFPFFSI